MCIDYCFVFLFFRKQRKVHLVRDFKLGSGCPALLARINFPPVFPATTNPEKSEAEHLGTPASDVRRGLFRSRPVRSPPERRGRALHQHVYDQAARQYESSPGSIVAFHEQLLLQLMAKKRGWSIL